MLFRLSMIFRWLSSKESTCSSGVTEDLVSAPWLGRSSGAGNGNPLQYSCLENPMDRGPWWATVHRTAKCWTQLKGLNRHPVNLHNFKLPLCHKDHLFSIVTGAQPRPLNHSRKRE